MSHQEDSGCARGLCRRCNDEETIARLTKERDEARAVLAFWRALLHATSHLRDNHRGTRGAPFHPHARAGIWDDPDRDGRDRPCKECQAWLALEVAMKKLEDACDRSP